MWFNKLSCNIGTIPGSYTNYLQFCSWYSRHLQLCWVSWCTLCMQTSSCKVASRSCKPTTANFDLGLLGLTPLSHIRKFFFTNLWGVVYAYKCIFELTIFLLRGQNVTCTCGFILQSDWYRQSKAVEVDIFSHGCYQALSSLHFRGESLGTKLAILSILNTKLYSRSCLD